MKLQHTAIALALLAAALNVQAHEDEESPVKFKPGMRYGDSASMGNGRFTAYTKISPKGKPEAVGVEFHESTLQNLPHHPLNDGKTCLDLNRDDQIDDHDECVGGHSRTLYFDPNPSQFKSITINWEAHGHVPAQVYDRPHFDFHFYTIPDTERLAVITGDCPGLTNCAIEAKAKNPVAPQYVHRDMFNTNLVYAHMGNHYADATAPEFNGGTFTNTFILGTFDGRITFYEPMMSKDYLDSKPDDCLPVKQPAAVQTDGWYPTQYCTRYNEKNKTYRISFESFTYRKGS